MGLVIGNWVNHPKGGIVLGRGGSHISVKGSRKGIRDNYPRGRSCPIGPHRCATTRNIIKYTIAIAPAEKPAQEKLKLKLEKKKKKKKKNRPDTRCSGRFRFRSI